MSANIQELLVLIRKRPEMYIGPSSVTRLGAFLEGYYFARWEIESGYEGFGAMKPFQEMVEERYSITLSISWDRILAFVAGDDAKGLDLFWKLWDEHIEQLTSSEASEFPS